MDNLLIDSSGHPIPSDQAINAAFIAQFGYVLVEPVDVPPYTAHIRVTTPGYEGESFDFLIALPVQQFNPDERERAMFSRMHDGASPGAMHPAALKGASKAKGATRSVAKPPKPPMPGKVGKEGTNRVGKKDISTGKVGKLSKISTEEDTNGVYTAEHTHVDGSVRKVIVKPQRELSGARLRPSITPRKDGERERAAVLVNRAMGSPNDLPDVHLRDLPKHGPSMVSEYRDSTPGSAEGLYSVPHHEVRHAAVFDAVIGNLDRHEGNFRLEGNHLVLIDHGLAFPEHPALSGSYRNEFQNARMMNARVGDKLGADDHQALDSLIAQRGPLTEQLRPLLPESAITGLFDRATFLKYYGEVPGHFSEFV